MGDVEIYTELGRYMMGPYGCLVTKAIHEKAYLQRIHRCGRVCGEPDAPGHVRRLSSHHSAWKEDAPCDHKYDVTGSLCENSDKFAIDRMLPEIEPGIIL